MIKAGILGPFRLSFGSRSPDVRKTTVLGNAMRAPLIHEVPDLPGVLPEFSVQTIVEVTLKGGQKRRYQKMVNIDQR